jgi:hypothetical protein
MKDVPHRIAENLAIRVFDPEVLRNPSFVQVAKGGFIAGSKTPEAHLARLTIHSFAWRVHDRGIIVH